DETIIRLDLRDLLERAGHEVAGEARDGEEAVALARELEPDLAIMDVKMPRLDGIEAAKRILDERPMPIVLLTAYGPQELVARAPGLALGHGRRLARDRPERRSQHVRGRRVRAREDDPGGRLRPRDGVGEPHPLDGAGDRVVGEPRSRGALSRPARGLRPDAG